ncbi:uncharacterized protein MELLADRAFT_92484 [Melampsora larici-populina 98AG31]|uniref:Uncharacterized protein n=1 Tax=Melampsora larici-populina (strain 98AG31 / pathotype 3-4-7) TaxID=747676 RepID=F4R8M1_MELLP|nr:uncharacterized protein MELLADRAFT_92484 [Melampsora larici-populina 98AG31]EGG11043.1 hypothetical protein MELLADRAFT_92484 [Melampsora larici-populina 98AG31]
MICMISPIEQRAEHSRTLSQQTDSSYTTSYSILPLAQLVPSTECSMSTPIRTSVLLPNYILQCVRDDCNPPRIDPELFLSKATNSNILDMIFAFYPHLEFDENAKDNYYILSKIFKDMVATQLHKVVVPSNRKPQNYFQASLRTPICGPQNFRTTIKCADDITPGRIIMFNSCALSYLRSGQYRLAAENLHIFVETYKYLTEDEIHEIHSTQEEAEGTLQSHVSFLQDAHQSIEALHIRLRDPDLSAECRQDMEVELKAARRTLESRRTMFDRAIQDVGFLAALKRHHRDKAAIDVDPMENSTD